jgi:hypothetical protein
MGQRAPKGQFKNSQVKEPDTDVSLESKYTPKKQGGCPPGGDC